MKLTAHAKLSGSENHKGFYLTMDETGIVGEIRPLDEDGERGEIIANAICLAVNTHERMKEMLEKIVADAELSNILRNCYVSITIINQARSLLSELKEGQ